MQVKFHWEAFTKVGKNFKLHSCRPALQYCIYFMFISAKRDPFPLLSVILAELQVCSHLACLKDLYYSNTYSIKAAVVNYQHPQTSRIPCRHAYRLYEFTYIITTNVKMINIERKIDWSKFDCHIYISCDQSEWGHTVHIIPLA